MCVFIVFCLDKNAQVLSVISSHDKNSLNRLLYRLRIIYFVIFAQHWLYLKEGPHNNTVKYEDYTVCVLCIELCNVNLFGERTLTLHTVKRLPYRSKIPSAEAKHVKYL